MTGSVVLISQEEKMKKSVNLTTRPFAIGAMSIERPQRSIINYSLMILIVIAAFMVRGGYSHSGKSSITGTISDAQ